MRTEIAAGLMTATLLSGCSAVHHSQPPKHEVTTDPYSADVRHLGAQVLSVANDSIEGQDVPSGNTIGIVLPIKGDGEVTVTATTSKADFDPQTTRELSITQVDLNGETFILDISATAKHTWSAICISKNKGPSDQEYGEHDIYLDKQYDHTSTADARSILVQRLSAATTIIDAVVNHAPDQPVAAMGDICMTGDSGTVAS